MLRFLRRAWRDWPPRMMAEWGGVAALASFLTILLLTTGAVARLDNVAYDAALRLAPRPTDQAVLIVAIDDRALEELGPWPWPRRVHAALLDRLSAAGAKAVAYDVLFVDPAPVAADDEALARAVAASGRVCLPVLIAAPGPNGAAFKLSPPLPPLAEAAAGLGHVDLDYDPDGVSRRANLAERAGARSLPHLMRCAEHVFRRGTARRPLWALPDAEGGASLVRTDTVLIPYGGGPGRVRTVSAASVIKGETPAGFIEDRVVVVGATAAGLHDRHSTPVSTRNEAMSGVEVQANLLEGLLTDRLIRPAPLWVQITVSLALIWLLLVALLVTPPRWSPRLGFALVAVAVLLAGAVLLAARVWLPPAAAVIVLLVVMPLWGWRRLEAASNYMVQELGRFSQEAEVHPLDEAPVVAGDPVERQIVLLRHATRRARQLRIQAAEAARQRERAVQLLGHDIRSPQSSILALLETAPAGQIAPELAGRVAGYARRTLALADNFVHLARAESGVLSRELLDLSALLTEAVDDIWPVANRAGVKLTTLGVDDERLVLGDRSLLSRALLNLLDNAIKYSPPGGEVTAMVAPLQDAPEDLVCVSVADQGPGLTEQQQARLFQRFERTGRVIGVGLGLTLVDEVARRHCGSIACVSRAGAGAAFILALPLAAEPER